MSGNDPYSHDPYGPRPEQPVQYDQYGRPLPPGAGAPPRGTLPASGPVSGPASGPSGGHGEPGAGSGAPGLFPAGPLSLPDETSIYVYGEAPDGYTQVAPAVTPPTPRRREPAAGTVYRNGQPYDPNVPQLQRQLSWQEMFGGLLTRPLAAIERGRDQAFWWPAFVVAAICGVLAMVANDKARDEVVTSTLSTSLPALLVAAVAVPGFCFVLGWVSHILARSLGGNGEAGPFITLATLITWLADVPRLIVSLFADDGGVGLVALGVVTLGLTAWLLTVVAMRVHELAWPRALGAVVVQLIALAVALKLPITEA